MYRYIHIHKHTHMCVYIINLNTYYLSKILLACTYTCINTCMCVCTMHINVGIYITFSRMLFTGTHAYTNTCMYLCMYVCTMHINIGIFITFPECCSQVHTLILEVCWSLWGSVYMFVCICMYVCTYRYTR